LSLASRARELTLALPDRFDPAHAVGLSASIGLSLDAGSACPEFYAIGVTPEGARVEEGRLPEQPLLTLKTGKATWASILLGKTQIETAYLHGKLRIEGQVTQSLRVRDIFKL